MKNKLLNKWDIILVGVICVCCIAAVLLQNSKNSGAIAQIYVDGEITSQINLTEVDESYTILLRTAVISVEKGRIRYLEANCPDKLCVNRGWLSKPGDVAACIPEKTVICIRGESRQKVHVVTY